MKKNNIRNFTISSILLILFLILMILIKFVDVQAIGPQGSSIGLATMNNSIFKFFGVNMVWYHITDWLGIIAIATAFAFAVLGIVQLIKYKSIKKINHRLILLGLFYIIVVAFYVLFELFIINYRPVLLSTNLEASFPSSHTMVVLFIMTTAILAFNYYIKNKGLRISFTLFSILLSTIIVVGRLISGVHWFTDIIGGILLASSLCMYYYSFVQLFDNKENSNLLQ